MHASDKDVISKLTDAMVWSTNSYMQKLLRGYQSYFRSHDLAQLKRVPVKSRGNEFNWS